MKIRYHLEFYNNIEWVNSSFSFDNKEDAENMLALMATTEVKYRIV